MAVLPLSRRLAQSILRLSRRPKLILKKNKAEAAAAEAEKARDDLKVYFEAKERANAESQRQEADRQRLAAERAQAEAIAQRKVAEDATEEAEKQKTEAELARDTTKHEAARAEN